MRPRIPLGRSLLALLCCAGIVVAANAQTISGGISLLLTANTWALGQTITSGNLQLNGGSIIIPNNNTIQFNGRPIIGQCANSTSTTGLSIQSNDGTAKFCLSGAANGAVSLGTGAFGDASGVLTLATLTPTTGVTGRTDGAAPGAGLFGEPNAPAATSCTTNTGLTSNSPVNITSQTFTAGEWDIWGAVGVDPAGTTVVTQLIGSVSTGSATLANAGDVGTVSWAGSETGLVMSYATGERILRFSTSTTVYLVESVAFGTSTAGACGRLVGRRVG